MHVELTHACSVQVDVTAPTPPGQAPASKTEVPAVASEAQQPDSKNVVSMVAQQQANQGWGKRDPWSSVAHGVVTSKPHTQASLGRFFEFKMMQSLRD